MRYLTYLLILLFVGACSKDTTETIDPVIKAERKALTDAREYGVYQDGKSEFLFVKSQHQLYINPSKLVFRIQTDRANKYVELKISEMPSAENGVSATLSNNVGLKVRVLGKVILLKSDNEHLWIWCDETHTGFILPWIKP